MASNQVDDLAGVRGHSRFRTRRCSGSGSEGDVGQIPSQYDIAEIAPRLGTPAPAAELIPALSGLLSAPLDGDLGELFPCLPDVWGRITAGARWRRVLPGLLGLVDGSEEACQGDHEEDQPQGCHA